MAYLKLIRPINLLLIIWVQLLIRYVFFGKIGLETALSNLEYVFLIFATVCIAAAGNVINDIQDIKIDRINKPKRVIVSTVISEKQAYNFYILLSILGVGAGFYVSNMVDKPSLAVVFIIISALLYMYATQFKSILLIGNVLVSFLVAMALIIVLLFDIYPSINQEITPLQKTASQVILAYATAAFIINNLREFIKDLQDIDGDKNGNRNTLPIALGRTRTSKIIACIAFLFLIGLLIHTYINLYTFKGIAFYFIFLIGAPILVFCNKAWNAKTKQEYKQLSLLLKLIMLSGSCSLWFYAEIILQQ